MAQKTSPLLPATEFRLHEFGERLRLARSRRGLTAKQVAQRAGMTAVTLRNLERGASGVTIGAYLAVLQVLGIDEDLDLLAREDRIGRELQDAALLPYNARRVRPRQPQRPPSSRSPRPPGEVVDEPATPLVDADSESERSGADWAASSGFVSADELASLLTADKPAKQRKKR